MLSSLGTSAQKKSSSEINFSTQDFRSALTLAKASHKKIFVDAYATWCAPCKKLSEITFKDAKAAAYFNKHFVNIRIDVEKGYGVELAKAWQIQGLPALLILDENGNLLADHTGYLNGNGLLQFAKDVPGRN